MLANMENVQYLTTCINSWEHSLQVIKAEIANNRAWRYFMDSGQNAQRENILLLAKRNIERELHSLKTKRGMLYKAMRDNQLSLIGE
jgi:hypothetical protein